MYIYFIHGLEKEKRKGENLPYLLFNCKINFIQTELKHFVIDYILNVNFKLRQFHP